MVRRRTSVILMASETFLLAVVVLGVSQGTAYSIAGVVLGAAVMAMPWTLERMGWVKLPALVQAWIVLAVGLHTVGLIWRLYDSVSWWDHMTHILSSSLIGLLAAMSLFIIERNSESIRLPPWSYTLLVVVFTMFTGTLWEVGEFLGDAAFGTRMQYSLTDTLNDIYFDLMGGIAAGVAWCGILMRGAPGGMDDIVPGDLVELMKDRFPDRS